MNISLKKEDRDKIKETPMEIFKKEISQRDNILPSGIQRIIITSNNITNIYTLDERNMKRKKV